MAEFVLEAGAILAGKYRIEAVLGRGGMGVVAAAYHLQLEHRVAIKLMLPHASENPEAVARFLREARAAARISSEHVARVFDVGALATGEPYIAMEYLQGSDLSELLAQQGRFSAEDAIEYLLQACEALAEAHAAGIVHRDLKPGNLYQTKRVDGQRLIKVLDFGISKMTGSAGTQSPVAMTRTSALMGSPLYMSPEQMAASKAVDARSDLWALGVVLYEMLCGSPPFNGETLPQVCVQIMTRPPQPLGERVPGLSPVLLAVVVRCLQKEPEARFQSVAEFAQALAPVASPRARQSIERILVVSDLPGGVGITRRSAPTAAELAGYAQTAHAASNPPSAPLLAPGTHATWADTGPSLAPKRKSRAGRWVGALMGSALLLGVTVWFARRLPAGSGPPASTASAAALGAISAPLPANTAPATPPEVEPALAAPPATPASAAPSSAAPPTAARVPVRVSPTSGLRAQPVVAPKPPAQAAVAPLVSVKATAAPLPTPPAPPVSAVSPTTPVHRSRL